MSAFPYPIDVVTFFYPLGNTPAVCLTQDLPPEKPAIVLLLGCGDVRSILFTTHVDPAASRHLDFTCCDNQALTLARNVLILTLILDDHDGKLNPSIWAIYYHFYLNDRDLKLLHSQAKSLLSLSKSQEVWRQGKYGKILRFCSQSTFQSLRQVWTSFTLLDMSPSERAEHLNRYEDIISRAKAVGKAVIGEGANITGMRSAAPVGAHAVEDVSKLDKYYWKHGVMEMEPQELCKATLANPMFASTPAALHYGTNCLLGFHLAPAYAGLRGSPKSGDRQKLVIETAKLQFRAWATAFRKRAGEIIVRFVLSDVFAFCYTLQQISTSKEDIQGTWYARTHLAEPLVLDDFEYSSGGTAPTSFNVIETSNLSDHVGTLNLLTATTSLLSRDPSAVLYTELLVRKERSLTKSLKSLLIAPFATMALVLGLFPVEYWTNATLISPEEERFSSAAEMIRGSKANDDGQLHCRLHWKKHPACSLTDTTSIRYDAKSLSALSVQIYLSMFSHESPQHLFSQMKMGNLKQLSSLPLYHRGSLVALLCFIKHTAELDWEAFIQGFIQGVEQDTTLLVGRNCIQELYAFLHLYKLHSFEVFQNPLSALGGKNLPLQRQHLPGVVRITVKVPRNKIKIFTESASGSKQTGSPPVHGILQSSRAYRGKAWQNLFAAVQMSFGKVTASGRKNTKDFSIAIEPDEAGWTGTSPLIVSFWAPTWVLLLEPMDAIVGLGLQSLPNTGRAWVSKLGLELNIFLTTLGDTDNVFVTDRPANLRKHSWLSHDKSSQSPPAAPSIELRETRQYVAVNLDKNSEIASLTAKTDIIKPELQQFLQNGAQVETSQLDPCVINITLHQDQVSHMLQVRFPVPVNQSASKLRIARKSSYIEIVAPIASPTVEKQKHMAIPFYISLDVSIPIMWNVPRLSLDLQPELDVLRKSELEWLNPHVAFQMSGRERKRREEFMGSGAPCPDARINLKDSILSLYGHFAGVSGSPGTQQASFFGLTNPREGGVHIIVIVTGVRLDVANHTAVLDTVVIPLNNKNTPKLQPFLRDLVGAGICQIQADGDEMRLWKRLLPVFVERCRTWTHKASCEYKTALAIPLSVENGQQCICSCGLGKLPKDHLSHVPQGQALEKFATRAVISPIYAVPYVDEIYRISPDEKKVIAAELAQKGVSEESLTGPAKKKGSTNPPPSNACAKCGKEAEDAGTSLLQCGGCKSVKYCSKDCQKADWKSHRTVCAPPGR